MSFFQQILTLYYKLIELRGNMEEDTITFFATETDTFNLKRVNLQNDIVANIMFNCNNQIYKNDINLINYSLEINNFGLETLKRIKNFASCNLTLRDNELYCDAEQIATYVINQLPNGKFETIVHISGKLPHLNSKELYEYLKA